MRRIIATMVTFALLCHAGVVLAMEETWVATGYCPCQQCCGKAPSDPLYGITASGKKAQIGMVACNWLPFGTVMRIDGVKYTVQDRGAKSIFGSKDNHKKRVDIYFENHIQALMYGKRKVTVEIIK